MNFNGFDFGGLFDIELAIKNLPFVLEGLPMTLIVSIAGMGIGPCVRPVPGFSQRF